MLFNHAANQIVAQEHVSAERGDIFFAQGAKPCVGTNLSFIFMGTTLLLHRILAKHGMLLVYVLPLRGHTCTDVYCYAVRLISFSR